jgi:hypothetical protein
MSFRNALSGDYEILGDDVDFIGDDALMLGEEMSVDPSVRQQAAAKILGRNALLLKETKPTKSRVFPLGFESDGPIAPGASVVIVSRPQVLFRGERLVIPSDIAGDFVVDDVKVGKDSQFVAEGSIPGRVLQENARDVAFQLDTAQISQDVSISITNISGAARTFRAALIGRAAE